MTTAQHTDFIDELKHVDISEPTSHHLGKGWRRVVLELHDNDRLRLDNLQAKLGVSTRREAIRRALLYACDHVESTN